MGWNGSGGFSFTYNWVNDKNNGIPITASRMDTQFADAVSGFQNCITRDGQGIATANISWGGFKITNLALATLTGDALSYGRAATVTNLSCTSFLSQGSGGTGGSITAQDFGLASILTFDGIRSTVGNAGSPGGFVVINASNGVSLASGGTSWSAISDYRAKNVMGPFTASGYIIDSIPVHVAALKETPDNAKAMFLAHEVQGAIPYAVLGQKDGPEMQRLESTDPLVPILWAEVRDLRRRLADLENR